MLSFFKTNELQCKCCGIKHIDADFLAMLNELRARFNAPLHLSSAYRFPLHNSRVSSTGRDGPHTTGKAADILVFGPQAARLLPLAIDIGFTGIGFKQHGPPASRFIHLDSITSPNRPAIWSYP